MVPLKLPREEKLQLVHRVQRYYETERGETIGELGAEQLVDYMIAELAPYLYNAGIADARGAFQEKMNQLDDELYALEKPKPRK